MSDDDYKKIVKSEEAREAGYRAEIERLDRDLASGRAMSREDFASLAESIFEPGLELLERQDVVEKLARAAAEGPDALRAALKALASEMMKAVAQESDDEAQRGDEGE
ncbi:hypothetical protein [Methylocystis bryophila]|uniref:Uncharacterized protein n=1 Tax=Methylocystis bryophila TaxID=655015 RepID=A0A1W6MW68_9HYPH|nr:hypothetical protein [Methylocystis bryophila]ARN81841.1 hypothetical protein B1812_12960 [Methylocystis bryophila]BDV37914.1 hypothetical protein DSM21852_11670 [Methylocystis bryophila]